jgi:hypothetical protein
MASNRPFRVGPVALTTTTTTPIFNPPVVIGGNGVEAPVLSTYALLRHIRISNKLPAAATFSLHLSAATAAAAAMAGVASNSFAGAGVLTVTSTTGFPASGTLTTTGITTVTGALVALTVTYTGVTGTTFTGCTTTVGGAATVFFDPGQAVLTVTNANLAGTEIVGTLMQVAANSYIDWYGALRINASDAIYGGAGTTLALTLDAEGEIGVA